tara:strand:+ start:9923 stop:10798 length:876 start_codon:yes stop_codon:yes gene_type:complete
MALKDLYLKNLNRLMLIPFILIVLSLIFIFMQYQDTGDFVNKDVTLEGGLSATLSTEKEFPNLEQDLEENFNEEFIVRKLTQFGNDKQIGILIESSEITNDELKPFLESITNIKLNSQNYSIEETGPSLGEAFFKQMSIAVITAFVLMAIVIVITFRTFIPSFGVIFSAFADMLITIGIINFINLRLSTAGIAAILLLIGYSIDTDVLLTTRLLKRKDDSLDNRLMSSIKTGLTMTFTTIIALSLGYFVSTSFVLKQMFLILVIGLFVDIIVTYCFNAGLLMRYIKRKENG